jgi:hypothetical protein
MQWREAGKHHIESSDGYRIAITGGKAGNQYSAFTPETTYDAYRLTLRTQYPQGSTIPQQRTLIGVFTNQQQAQAACEQHHQSPAPSA